MTRNHVALFYARNITGGSSFTVNSGSLIDRTMAVLEYSGVATTTYAFDKTIQSVLPLDEATST